MCCGFPASADGWVDAIPNVLNRSKVEVSRLKQKYTRKEISRIKLSKWGRMLGFSPDSKTLDGKALTSQHSERTALGNRCC